MDALGGKMDGLNLVNQLRFARSEFRKGFSGVTEEEGFKRLMPMNSIAWIVGHLGWHEQHYWLKMMQGIVLYPELIEANAFGKPPIEVSFSRMVECWESVIQETDIYLSTLTLADLDRTVIIEGRKQPFHIGTKLNRMIYHYWYHTGEIQAIRQLLGHKDLPDFVSDDIETIGKFYLDL
jgi:hypothetical protein